MPTLRSIIEAAGTVALEQFCQDNLAAIVEALVSGDNTAMQGCMTNIGIAPATAAAAAPVAGATVSASSLLLTSLSTTTATPVASTDSILVAIGKIEARMPVGLVLSSAFSSSSSTLVDVPGWSFPVVAGANYAVEAITTYQSPVITTGGKLALATTGATGAVNGWMSGALTPTTFNNELRGTVQSLTSFMLTSGVGTANTPCSMYMRFIFNCTGSGTFKMQWASEVNLSSAQLNAGSTLIYQRLS